MKPRTIYTVEPDRSTGSNEFTYYAFSTLKKAHKHLKEEMGYTQQAINSNRWIKQTESGEWAVILQAKTLL